MKLSRFDVGQSVYGDHHPTGERLTLRANALRPFGLAGHRFSADGVPGQDVLLIEDGVLRARHATQRYAQYLGIPATGEPGDTEVRTGGDGAGGPPGRGVGVPGGGLLRPGRRPHHGGLRLRDPPGVEVTPQGRARSRGAPSAGTCSRPSRRPASPASCWSRGEYAGPAGVRFESLRVSGDD